MTPLQMKQNSGRYNLLNSTIFFQAQDGTEYSIDKENVIDLAYLLLEALGADPKECDKLFETLESEEN